MTKIIIQKSDFDLSKEVELLRNSNKNIGAIVSFVGTVRDLDNDTLNQLTLEHYPKMTEKSLEKIVDKAKNRWQLKGVTIIHRIGELKVSDQIVLVITTSKHRQFAFEACEFIMDYLKTSAPFWKKEQTANSENWVEAKNSDYKQLDKWH